MLGSGKLTKFDDPELQRRVYTTVPGMAHFAFTGPPGTTCGGCAHWQSVPINAVSKCCLKYRAMTPKVKAVQHIPKNQPSCMFFEPPWKPEDEQIELGT